jgi:fatty acid desaturase
MVTVLVVIGLSIVLRVGDHLYYWDADRVLAALRLKPVAGERAGYYRPLDPLFSVLPYVWTWLDIVAACLMARRIDAFPVYVLLGLVVGTRFRWLHEISHIGVHRGLCRSAWWQYAAGNVLAQYPMFRRTMSLLCVVHAKEHHRYVNELGQDPNLARIIAVGVRPGMSSGAFYFKLLHPLTPAGLRETAVGMANNVVVRNDSWRGALVRVVVAVVTVSFFVRLGLGVLLSGYVVPLVLWYPLFSWVSLLAEHRWYAECDVVDRKTRECINGRPTAYRGVVGWLIRQSVSPATDSYHLVHSLYPHLRWNYMRAVDKALRERLPEYSRFGSEGLFIRTGTRHSALSELRDRVTMEGDPADLADWARTLAPSTGAASPSMSTRNTHDFRRAGDAGSHG